MASFSGKEVEIDLKGQKYKSAPTLVANELISECLAIFWLN